MYLSIPLENVLFHDNEQPVLYASPDMTRGRHDNSVEAFHLLLAMHATSICEPCPFSTLLVMDLVFCY